MLTRNFYNDDGSWNVFFKKLNPNATIPKRMTPGSSGMDLHACCEEIVLEQNRPVLIPTGLSMALPQGFEAQVRPRSGLALKHGVTVLNAPGTIDADYRGEVGVILIKHRPGNFTIQHGDRIAQLVIAPIAIPGAIHIWDTEEELPETQRGTGGFGSTGS